LTVFQFISLRAFLIFFCIITIILFIFFSQLFAVHYHRVSQGLLVSAEKTRPKKTTVNSPFTAEYLLLQLINGPTAAGLHKTISGPFYGNFGAGYFRIQLV
uniref:Secreted protein n=1 Tax=Haemonchus placei TaxID=6290 RepID=A0A0N4X282_HAEPC